MNLLGTAVVLLAVLAFAVVRPRGLPEAAAAIPCALLLVALGAISTTDALHEVRSLGPTVGFLAAILVLGYLAEVEGVFAWAGGLCAAGSRGDPRRLLATVFVLASLTTAALSLDATVILLTPVVLTTAARLHLPARPHVYACTHLANSASILLPVSNLTNLLAYEASGLSFGGFAARMALPWLVSLGVEYLVFRAYFRRDLSGSAPAVTTEVKAPVFPLVVLALTLVGFLVVPAVWAAAAGAVCLGVRALATGKASWGGVASSASVPFLGFVLGLGVIVAAVQQAGLKEILAAVVPSGVSLPALLGVAAVAAVLANLVNNLPAVLLLLPIAAASGTPAVLAVLLGVNLGPNLTYFGSLATLLWRRLLMAKNAQPRLGDFLKLGALTVPLGLVATVTALWLSLRLMTV